MTAIGRTTATRLAVGDRILVELYGVGDKLIPTTKKLTGKNGVVVATIQTIETTLSRGGYSRSQTLRTFVTDQGSTRPVPPSQTFALAPAPVVEEPTASEVVQLDQLPNGRYVVGANTDPSIPSNTERVVEAAVQVADIFASSLGFGLAEHLTCREAELVAELLRATGSDEELVACFLSDHGSSDDEGDEHYQGETTECEDNGHLVNSSGVCVHCSAQVDEDEDEVIDRDQLIDEGDDAAVRRLADCTCPASFGSTEDGHASSCVHRHDHLPSCVSCGEKVYRVGGELVLASNHAYECEGTSPAGGQHAYRDPNTGDMRL